ncbi:hypothetical protein [Lentilactobacillus buchneri]|uniref:Uncharacterized protein n=1 Tax=Lentilactobacillus buchneri DSM 20057 TaxID=1423728 RepID=A0A4V3A3X5_LENBU|nr:hypothetical protein [Lentilactobacillus buchneri]WCJ51650.1 type II secretion system protein [Lentilactobacillus sp. Egmn17]AEB73208.1 hypothetical protein Lbuc_0949 [Lentilactobacillus buchneri NRRL B-30929]KRK68607.1 hypothetical protein FC79_GL000427 [Lentilactobacillus buchneri DSM 20057]MCT2882267.1 type II secretion system protein [Lentilactobacillus buchneri]MCT2899216.1 type II secretion system protein [Lentilactobacillus buchneri]
MWKGTNKRAFTVIDSLIGLTIICTFSLFYIQTTHQMNETITNAEKVMTIERQKYETEIVRE